MLAILLAFWGLSNAIRGVSCLTCSFDDGLCGWQHPENATQKWILADGISRHFQSPMRSYPLKLLNASLIYPNFTGSGFLTFYLSHFRGIKFSILVGKMTIFKLGYNRELYGKWTWYTTRINASQETVALQILSPSYKKLGAVGIDDLQFYTTQAKRCENLSTPVNMSMNCTATNHVGSICNFACKEGGRHHVIGSRERTCLPTGVWSGLKPLCGKPRLRLKALTSNSTQAKGMLEILINGTWSKVAIYFIDNYKYASLAVCRSLGFAGRAVAFNIETLRPSRGYKEEIDSWLVLGECTTNAQSIDDCRRSDIARHLVSPAEKYIPIFACENTTCPMHCICKELVSKYSFRIKYTVTCSAPASIHVLKEIPPETTILSLNNITWENVTLTSSSFDHLKILSKIEIPNAGIRKLPRNIFSKLFFMFFVNLDGNLLTSLADIQPGTFVEPCPTSEQDIQLSANLLTSITKDSIRGLRCVVYLHLSRNKISFIEEGSLLDLSMLQILDLSSNRLIAIKSHYFGNHETLYDINVRNNSISSIEEKSFNYLTRLDLRFNKLTNISSRKFRASYTRELYLGNNQIQRVPDDLLHAWNSLFLLDISKNPMSKFTSNTFRRYRWLLCLTAAKAGITEIEDNTFQRNRILGYLFLDDNKLTRITTRTFYGIIHLEYLTLSSNPLHVIEEGAFSKMKKLRLLYLMSTQLQIISIGSTATFASLELQIVHSTGEKFPGMDTVYIVRPLLRSSGYWCVEDEGWLTMSSYCFPCEQGQYKLMTVFNERGCLNCPPGGFYQDSIAHVGVLVHGVGCKQCPLGTFVSPENAPGKAEEYCTACPRGTDLTRRAGFRACPCLDNYYRLNRFANCIECPLGYKCTNETVELDLGFFWIWHDDVDKENYLTFSEKLQVENKDHDLNWITYDNALPMPYVCPFFGSCQGGTDASCSQGYEGTLCAVCSKGFYKMYSGCSKCPSLYLFIGQCLAVLIIIGVIVLVIIKEKRSSESKVRSLMDTIFSSLKIIIGFYQVTSGTLRAYSYIKWPAALTNLMKFTDVVQLNIFKLFPVECVQSSIAITPYTGLVTYVSLDVIVILVAIGYFYARKFFLQMTLVDEDDQRKKLSTCKINCYRVVFLLLFLTYPATCEKVFQVLPAGCIQICDNQQTCNWYLRSDYSIQCYTSVYNKYVVLAYCALVIPVTFPVVVVFLLWKYCRNMNDKNAKEIDVAMTKDLHKKRKDNKSNDEKLQTVDECEIKTGMRFIYENYSDDCWYWEVIELIRKVILTSVLVYSRQQGRLSLGTSAIMSGFYAIFFAHSKPIPHTFEHWLHLGSLMATLANQLMGMLLRVPAETVSITVSEENDNLGIAILLMFANVFLLIMILVRYLYGVAISIQRVKKNPECSVDCVLSVVQAMSTGTGEQQLAVGAGNNPKHDSNQQRNKNKE